MSTIFTTDLFYPPGACTSSSNYATSNTGAVGSSGYGTMDTSYFDMHNKDAHTIRASKDVIIDGRSMRDFMESMEQRLAILVPDPKKLEHFQSLQKAYAHYKTLEALCELPTGDQHA